MDAIEWARGAARGDRIDDAQVERWGEPMLDAVQAELAMRGLHLVLLIDAPVWEVEPSGDPG